MMARKRRVGSRRCLALLLKSAPISRQHALEVGASVCSGSNGDRSRQRTGTYIRRGMGSHIARSRGCRGHHVRPKTIARKSSEEGRSRYGIPVWCLLPIASSPKRVALHLQSLKQPRRCFRFVTERGWRSPSLTEDDGAGPAQSPNTQTTEKGHSLRRGWSTFAM